MSRSDGPTGPRVDWRGWLALGWAAWFAILYANVVLHERAPGLARRIGQSLGL